MATYFAELTFSARLLNRYTIFNLKKLYETNDIIAYETDITEGFIKRFEEYKKEVNPNEQIIFKFNKKRAPCKIVPSEKEYNQSIDTDEEGMQIIFFPKSYYEIYIPKNTFPDEIIFEDY